MFPISCVFRILLLHKPSKAATKENKEKRIVKRLNRFFRHFSYRILYIFKYTQHIPKVNKYVYVGVQDTGWLHFLLLFNFFFSFLPRKYVFFLLIKSLVRSFISLCFDSYTRNNKKMFHVNQFLFLKFTLKKRNFFLINRRSDNRKKKCS